MKKINRIFTFAILLLIYLYTPLHINKLQAADATLEFKHVSFDEDVILTSIYINTAGYNVNGVTADFTYSSNILEVTDIDIENSVFENFVENDYSQEGTVYLSCYSLEGYTGEDILATITFKAIASGTATLQFAEDAIALESDTSINILSTPESQTYTVSEDLITLPETGSESEALAISGIVLFIALVMIVIFALAGFTMWGGIYFSLGKWAVSSEASLGVGDKKKKKFSFMKQNSNKRRPKNKSTKKTTSNKQSRKKK